MNTKTIITLLLVGTTIVLLPLGIEFLSAQNTQNNVTKLMLELEASSANLDKFKIDETLKYLLFWLGAFVICVAIVFMWRQRKHQATQPD